MLFQTARGPTEGQANQESIHVDRFQMSVPARRGRRNRQPRLVAQPVAARDPAPAFRLVRPDGPGLQLRRGVPPTRPGRGQAGPARTHDRVPGLVAGGFRSLRSFVHPHGLAQRRHLPQWRRPWRRSHRQPALRAAQQLAGQRQPGQGAAAAVADQAEIRSVDLLGRPDDPHR